MHGGLDCISTWRDLPAALGEASGLPVLAYDRYGYGRSEALVGGRDISYRREEAGPVLGEVLRQFDITDAVMFGHSDGGAMSLLGAVAHPRIVRGILACSPAIAFDQLTVEGMARARRAFEQADLRDKLMRHHGERTDAMFWGWHDPWATGGGMAWDMAAEIAAVDCPTTALFGGADEYGWRPSAIALLRDGRMALEVDVLPGVGHHPHMRARAETLTATERLLARL